jgi:hypothetical protein
MIRACLSRIEAQLERVVQLFATAAPGIRLLHTKGQGDILGYFGLISNGSGEAHVPLLGTADREPRGRDRGPALTETTNQWC